MRFFSKIEINLLHFFFFFTLFLINYFSLKLSFHGSREIHLYVLFVSLFHSIFCIILIYYFFSLKKIKYSKLYLYIKKNNLDFIISIVLFVSAFVLAYFYSSMIDKNNLLYLFYESTSEFPKTLSPIKNEFISFVFSLSILICYFIFRIFNINKFFSLAVCIIFLSSPFHFYHLIPSPFRDYFSKTIILLIIFSFFFIIFKKIDYKSFKVFILFTTLILKFGLYVRQDLIVFLLPFILVIIFTLVRYKGVKIKYFYILIFSILFILSPQIYNIFGIGVGGMLIGGLTTPTEVNFLLDRPLYDLGYIYHDDYLWILSFLDQSYFTKIIINFPADFLIKMIATSLQILNLPSDGLLPMPGIESKFLFNFYEFRSLILNLIKNEFIILIFLFFISLLIYNNLYQGIIASIIFLILLFYPVLNFYGRHFFYLEFIPLLASGVFFQTISIFLFRYKKILTKRFFNKITKVVILLFLFLISGFSMIKVSKIYQKSNYENNLNVLKNIKKEQLIFSQTKKGNKISFNFNAEDLFQNKKYISDFLPIYANVEHIILELDFNNCGAQTIWPILKYKSKNILMDYSRTIRINKKDILNKNGIVLLPVYRSYVKINQNAGTHPGNIYVQTEFEGIELNNFEHTCLKRVYKLVKFPENLPKSLTILGYDDKPYFEFYSKNLNYYEVPKNLKNNIYQSKDKYIFKELIHSEIEYKNENFSISSLPSKLVVSAGELNNSYCKFNIKSFESSRLTNNIYNNNKNYFMKQHACLNDKDLLWTKSLKKNKGDIFIFEGKIINGGIRVGFISKKDNRAYVEIKKKGNFKILLEVPENGNYNFGISNYLNLYLNKENNIRIKKIGWLKKN
tara:strand:+ start:6085 stop:8637 length:2553 start_codon:yes stop_codon:yes gene_type:complete